MVQKLRKLMEEVETIKAEREVIENEFKEAKFDMSKLKYHVQCCQCLLLIVLNIKCFLTTLEYSELLSNAQLYIFHAV